MLVVQSCPILCDPMDCSPPGSSVHGISQARILEWVTIPFSRGSSKPRDWDPELQAESLHLSYQGSPIGFSMELCSQLWFGPAKVHKEKPTNKSAHEAESGENSFPKSSPGGITQAHSIPSSKSWQHVRNVRSRKSLYWSSSLLEGEKVFIINHTICVNDRSTGSPTSLLGKALFQYKDMFTIQVSRCQPRANL